MSIDWGTAAAMCAVSAAISGLISIFVTLVIKNAILEASKKITDELHALLAKDYVLSKVYEVEMKEIRATLEWLSSD